ncbi:Flowering time control protein FCA [Porphyridium purpureum]|uniref:Flowering time control protein FCA n=1 Tax=Porphyridium purpureum TaxID=35688 RepID=A0A5J4Z218_PORPP|nr:Flowering time control protein FCA [Porphyridium purpureum]|eukprot:POR0759..scf208_2
MQHSEEHGVSQAAADMPEVVVSAEEKQNGAVAEAQEDPHPPEPETDSEPKQTRGTESPQLSACTTNSGESGFAGTQERLLSASAHSQVQHQHDQDVHRRAAKSYLSAHRVFIRNVPDGPNPEEQLYAMLSPFGHAADISILSVEMPAPPHPTPPAPHRPHHHCQHSHADRGRPSAEQDRAGPSVADDWERTSSTCTPASSRQTSSVEDEPAGRGAGSESDVPVSALRPRTLQPQAGSQNGAFLHARRVVKFAYCSFPTAEIVDKVCDEFSYSRAKECAASSSADAVPENADATTEEALDGKQVDVQHTRITVHRVRALPEHFFALVRDFENEEFESDLVSSASETAASLSGKVFVGQIPKHVDELGMVDLFWQFGKLLDVKVLRARGMSRGCGFVRYSNVGEALQAIDEMIGSEIFADLKQLPLNVRLADNLEQKTMRKKMRESERRVGQAHKKSSSGGGLSNLMSSEAVGMGMRSRSVPMIDPYASHGLPHHAGPSSLERASGAGQRNHGSTSGSPNSGGSRRAPGEHGSAQQRQQLARGVSVSVPLNTASGSFPHSGGAGPSSMAGADSHQMTALRYEMYNPYYSAGPGNSYITGHAIVYESAPTQFHSGMLPGNFLSMHHGYSVVPVMQDGAMYYYPLSTDAYGRSVAVPPGSGAAVSIPVQGQSQQMDASLFPYNHTADHVQAHTVVQSQAHLQAQVHSDTQTQRQAQSMPQTFPQ